VKNIKKLFANVLYVSKLTGTRNKKVLILGSIVLSQLSAFTDVALIGIFAALIADQYTNIELINNLLNLFLEYKPLIMLIVVLRFFFQYTQSMILRRIEESADKNLKVYLLQEIFDKRNYSVADSYFFINVLSGHVAFFYSSFASFLNSFLQIFAYSSYLFISDPGSVAIFFTGVIVLIFPIRKLLSLAKSYVHITYEKGQESNEEIARVVENLFLIKILKKDKDELKQFSNTLEEFKESMLKNHSIGLINGYLPSFVTLTILSFVLAFTSYASMLTLDFIGVVLRLFQSLGNLTTSANRLVNSQVHIEKFYEIEKNKAIQNIQNFNQNSGDSIKVKNLSFRYFNSDINIFEEINFELKKNTHTVITGENGSGKSTLLGLLAGVFYSNDGTVESFTDNYAYIGATPLIFNATLHDNVMYGNDNEIDEETILEYLRFFNTFKEDSEYNLQKTISNKTLSSGQMQKIAFIRALMANTEVLLLDEATANLDDASKNLIFKTLKEKKVTIINSTHDPESFIDVDNTLNIIINNEKRSIVLS
jgi:ABC-type bacteriocin/lantibiotic exporter with double-glycine peptidase domain